MPPTIMFSGRSRRPIWNGRCAARCRPAAPVTWRSTASGCAAARARTAPAFTCCRPSRPGCRRASEPWRCRLTDAEVVEAIALLKDLPIGAGDVVTGDAAFTYRPVIAAIRAKGAGYFLFVKANQPELQAEIAHVFGDDSPRTGSRAARRPKPAGRSA